MVAYPMAGISLDVSHDATATRNPWRLENSATFTPNLLWPIGSSFLHQKTPFWVLCIIYIYIYILYYLYVYVLYKYIRTASWKNYSPPTFATGPETPDTPIPA